MKIHYSPSPSPSPMSSMHPHATPQIITLPHLFLVTPLLPLLPSPSISPYSLYLLISPSPPSPSSSSSLLLPLPPHPFFSLFLLIPPFIPRLHSILASSSPAHVLRCVTMASCRLVLVISCNPVTVVWLVICSGRLVEWVEKQEKEIESKFSPAPWVSCKIPLNLRFRYFIFRSYSSMKNCISRVPYAALVLRVLYIRWQ